MKNNPIRGFSSFIGEVISKIDATAVNVVKVAFESGKEVEIDCDEQIIGIGILQVTEVST